MTTPGGGTPRTRRTTSESPHAAPPVSGPPPGGVPRQGTPREWDIHHGWNATDEHGYQYRDERQRGSTLTSHAFFAGPLREYVASLGHPISLLQAGCGASLGELGADELEAAGLLASVTAADTDDPLIRQALEDTAQGSAAGYDDVILGDLRTVGIPPRAFDVVYCASLLERIQHVELVLDRLVSALRPGGLLLIRTHDRETASAFLDRILPSPARKALWRRLRPDAPGPFPPVYEKTVTERGIASYALMRGLVVAQHGTQHFVPATPRRISSSVRIACAVISRLTRGRFGNTHDELLYVIRKPQDRFARVV
jgi:SAM-dependent methyltransferase